MADNVAVTAGSGTTIATDEISGVQYQRVKVVVGADGTNSGDASPSVPLPVQSPGFSSSDSQTRPNNTDAYAAFDVVGESPADNLSFTGVGSVQGGCVFITGASLLMETTAVPSGMSSFRLHLYSSGPTGIADSAAYNLPSGDRGKYLGYIELPAPVDLGDTIFSRVDNLNFHVKLANASTTLYGILSTVGAFTPAASVVATVSIFGVQC